MTTIWIDGDACPKAIKEIIFKAVIRVKINCILVANQYINLPPSPFIKRIMVEQGFDKADQVIEEAVIAGDIVVTSDLPLVDDCLKKQAKVLSPRGEVFSSDTIKQKLAMRDFNDVLRSSGIHTGGPKALSQKDIRLFANQLDSIIAKRIF